MALVVKDRVRETSTTTGTGTITLAGAVTGYQAFSAIGDGNTTYYTIYLQGSNEWEVGIGTYTASGTTLSRDTILASSNGGSAVNFSAGTKDVFVTYPAGRSVWYDTATNVTIDALTVSNNTILGDASTDTVRVNGYMGVGGAGTANAAVYLTSTALTGTSQYGFYSTPRASSAATSQAAGFTALVRTEAAAFTLTNAYGLSVENVTKGAGSTITNQHGVYISDQTQGTNNYGVTSAVSSGANKWNIYASGTAQNYFAGNVLLGTTATRTSAGVTPAFQVEGTTVNAGSQYLTVNNATAANSAIFQFNRSRGTANGAVTAVASGDTLGRLFFAGADGTGLIIAASISAQVDGTPGTNDMPGRLLFSTTDDGASSPTERLRLSTTEAVFNEPGNDYDFRVESDTNTHALFVQGSDGYVGIGTNAPISPLQVVGDIRSSGDIILVGGAGTPEVQFFQNAGNWKIAVDNDAMQFIDSSASTERMRIDSSGNVGIGTNNPGARLEVSGQDGTQFFLRSTGTTAARIRGYVNSAESGVIGFLNGGGQYFETSGSERMRIDSAGTVFMRDGTSTTNTNSSRLVVGGTISETVSSTQYLVASQYDIGTAPNEIPLNQYLGNLAYQDASSIAGQVGLSAGTAALPSLVSATDTDTGMWFPAANTLAWSVGGSEQMRLTSTGLGIGTNSPQTTLDARGIGSFARTSAGGAVQTINVQNFATDTNSAAEIVFNNSTTFNANQNTKIGVVRVNSPNAGDMDFYINLQNNGATQQRLYLNSSGNLGLGVTPSAWSAAYRMFQASTGASFGGTGNISIVGSNYYNDGTSKYIGTGLAALYLQDAGVHKWFNAPSGTAGNAITFTQAMTLDASGNLSVGTTSTFGKVTINDGALAFSGNASAPATNVGIYRGGAADNLIFATGGSERARITSGGYFKASNNGAYLDSTGPYHEIRQTTSGNNTLQVSNNTADPYGVVIAYTGASPNGTGNYFLYCRDSGPTLRAEIRSNGGLANYQANDVNLSDQRTKKDIVAAPSYWDKIKGIEIVHFKYKDQTHDDNNVGVIAQQVEQVAPEFVDQDGWGETPEDGVPLKSIYTSDMYHAAIKALQEAMARIEQLEAKVSALEAKGA